MAGGAALLLVAGVILGPESLWSTLRGARDVVRAKIEDEKGGVQSAAEIRVCLTCLLYFD